MNEALEITEKQVEQIRKKDRNTIELIYKQTYPMVERYILKNSGTHTDAQDIFQDAFYLLLKKAENTDFTLTSKTSTFLVGISRNLWLKKLTRKGVNFDELRIEQTLEDDIDSTDIEHISRIKLMHNCLLKIGEPCRTILEQFYFLQTSMKDIAKMLHYANANTAKNQKYKCFMRLRKMMIVRKND